MIPTLSVIAAMPSLLLLGLALLLLLVLAIVVLAAVSVIRHPLASAQTTSLLTAGCGRLCGHLETAAQCGTDICRTWARDLARFGLSNEVEGADGDSHNGSNQRVNEQEPQTKWTEKKAHADALAMTVIARLIYLAPAVVILVSDFTLGRMRSAALQLGDVASGPSLIGADVAAGLLWLSITVLWGIVIADAVNLTPPAMQLLPFLPARLRRPVAAIGMVGLTCTVVAIGLLFLAGQLVIDGYSWPLASEALSLIQGMLLAGASVCAIPALILGLASVTAVGCALVALVCAVLAQFLGVARHALVLASEIQPSLIYVASATAPAFPPTARVERASASPSHHSDVEPMPIKPLAPTSPCGELAPAPSSPSSPRQ